MSSMKKQLEDMGILKKAEKSVDSFKCLECNHKPFETQKRYENHLKLLHDEAWSQLNKSLTTANTSKPPNPSKSNQTVIETVVLEKTKDSNICEYATSWSMVRLGFADTFCEDLKKMKTMHQLFFNTTEYVHPTNNAEPFTYVTQTRFRKILTLMATNIKQQLLERIKQSPFYSLHIGETVDVQSFSHLLVIVRYKHKKSITEDLLFSQALNSQPTQILVIIDTVVRSSGLDWKNCVGISMDGERAKNGPLKNVAKSLSKNYLSIPIKYTISRRGEFITNNLGSELTCVLNDVIKLVNEFKTCDGVKLSDQIETKFKNLLIHTENYWLSYGHTLQTMFHMAQYRQISVSRLSQLAYLVDIIDHFNQLNGELQKHDANIFNIYDGISAMYDRLGTFRDEIRNNNFSAFPNMRDIFEQHGTIPNDIKSEIKTSLKDLRRSLLNNLPVPKGERGNYEWIRKPLDVKECPDIFTTCDELAEWRQLKKDKPEFNENHLESFWIAMYQKYPNISERAIKFLLNFRSSRFYEIGFAALVDLRTKHLTDLSSEDSYLRIKLSPLKPHSGPNID